MQPKVSIIVPIYGLEKYLHQCIDSILAQTLREIEVILVDDGSKDRCPEIIDEYAKKDRRVIAIHQPNGGYGKAVNHGLKFASGEYKRHTFCPYFGRGKSTKLWGKSKYRRSCLVWS
jgi:glycosyltransferase involved in cell wall biosynthesis